MLTACLCAALVAASHPLGAQTGLPSGGRSVLKADALLTTAVGGLERTGARSEVTETADRPFARALKVTIRTSADDTNATQLTMLNVEPVQRGDAMLAVFHVRGGAAGGRAPGRIMFLFEKATSPWTKSVSHGVLTRSRPQEWRVVYVPFVAAESYEPGQAMASLRFAFGPQTVEVGGLSVLNYGASMSADRLVELASAANPIGKAVVSVDPSRTAQRLLGLGGNFCQPRYGATEPMDAVGLYNLTHLKVLHARVGIPLNWWAPQPGVYRDEGQARAALLLMKDLSNRRIPIVGSVWEGPEWLLGGRREQSGRTLPREKYDACIEAIGAFLKAARDTYGVTVEHFSFNEPDYGVNFRFTARQMADFIRQAGPRFRALGLKTKFLIGDTANGAAAADYCRVLLKDDALKPFLGPIAFHCWDALSSDDDAYTRIAALGREFGKPIWCLEAGHDAQLWQQPNPWRSWDNALRTALAYERTLRLTGAEVMDYWTYQHNYPLVSRDGQQPFPVFHVMAQMQEVFAPGARVAAASADAEDLRALATLGPSKARMALLIVNPAGPGTVTVTGLPVGAARIETSTGEEQRRSSQARVAGDGRMTLDVPTRSVVTVVLGE